MALDCKIEVVIFRDKSKLTLSESNWNIGMKLIRLTQEAEGKPPLDETEAQIFRVNIYPKLLACVVKGSPPTEEEAAVMPEAELDKWYEAAKRLNPKWFAMPEKPQGDESKKKDTGNA